MIHRAIVCFGWIICSSFAANHIAPINNQTALVGENVKFICEIIIEGESEINLIRWLGPFNRKSNDYNWLKSCMRKTICVLDLFNVTQSVQGKYTCFQTRTQRNKRAAWLTVLSETDIQPPENVSAIHTPNGVLVRWDKPNTALEVTSYRVYYKRYAEDNLDIWKYSDASGTASHILIEGFRKREDFTLNVQAIYKNYHSRNVSRSVFSAADLIGPLNNQTALVGENVTFVCKISKDRDLQIQVLRWNRPFNRKTKDIVIKSCMRKRICVLDLFNVTQAVQGWYSCFVSYSVHNQKGTQWNERTAWLTVLSETDIQPPENVSALHTPNGVLVTWDQPNTALEVTSFRVYYKSNSEDNLDIWKYSDASGTTSHILILGFRKRENYTLKVQAIYNNYHSRNVSRTIFTAVILQDRKSNTDDSEYKVYLFSGISAMLILSLSCFGFALRKRFQKIYTGLIEVSQSDRSGSDTSERSTERESVLYEEIDDFTHSYESVTSNGLVRQRSLISNKTANELVQDESYNRERLESLTATEVLYPDSNGSTNYIHPVYLQMDSNTRFSQYVYGRIADIY